MIETQFDRQADMSHESTGDATSDLQPVCRCDSSGIGGRIYYFMSPARRQRPHSEAWGAFVNNQRERTEGILTQLRKHGLKGQIAAELFVAQQASTWAKFCCCDELAAWRYQRKGEAIERLCSLLAQEGHDFDWGWQEDRSRIKAPWIIYVDLPFEWEYSTSGFRYEQVSFHATHRGEGPTYRKWWDEKRNVSDLRIVQFCDELLACPIEAPAAT